MACVAADTSGDQRMKLNHKEPVGPSRAQRRLFFLLSLLHVTVKKHGTNTHAFIFNDDYSIAGNAVSFVGVFVVFR